MTRAYERVTSNNGSAGVDVMDVKDLRAYLNTEWNAIKSNIFNCSYKPSAVRKVEIPKPNGGVRMLGIPTALDRLIQQAISQYLIMVYDKGFSENSYGFRPNRNAHQAVLKAKEYVNSGYEHVIELDLEKFFDQVNHDYLMYLLSQRIKDKILLTLIRKYLQAGIMVGGLIEKRTSGTPQGSPLSPILSNILLDVFDKELEKRGHKFVRYADDCSIYVRSKRAAFRVIRGVSRFIEEKLKLNVNKTKSGVRKPDEIKLLGFTFYKRHGEYVIQVSPQALSKCKEKVKTLTKRNCAKTFAYKLAILKRYAMGWVNYFKVAELDWNFKELDKMIRKRLRMYLWISWKTAINRAKNLRKLGANSDNAYMWSHTSKGVCRTAKSPILQTTLTNVYFKENGLFSLLEHYRKQHV